MVAHPHSGIQDGICTLLLHSKSWPNTQKIRYRPETCKGWLHHLKHRANQRMMQWKAKHRSWDVWNIQLMLLPQSTMRHLILNHWSTPSPDRYHKKIRLILDWWICVKFLWTLEPNYKTLWPGKVLSRENAEALKSMSCNCWFKLNTVFISTNPILI